MIRTPTLDALLRNPGALPEAVVDCLQECGATLVDVLRLYAGTVPEFTDGLPQEVLVQWCRATEPYYPVHASGLELPLWRWEAVRGLKLDFGPTVAGMNLDVRRREQVSATDILHAVFVQSRQDRPDQVLRRVVERGGELYHDVIAAFIAVSCRDLKRRVLALFPKVPVWTRKYPVTYKFAEAVLRDRVYPILEKNGFRLDLSITSEEDVENRTVWFSQTIPAPDLIPPDMIQLEPQHGTSYFHRVYGPWRRMQDVQEAISRRAGP